MIKYTLLFFSIIFSQIAISQSITADALLQKSIQYHDPEGKWEMGEFHFPLFESRSNGGYRLTDIKFDNKKRIFELTQIRGKDRLYRYLSPKFGE